MAQLLPPESAAIDVMSREVGVSVATLERWRADALAGGSGERSGAGGQRWTAAARLQAVIATAAMDEATRSAWCREQGLYQPSWTHASRTRSPVSANRVRPVRQRPRKTGGWAISVDRQIGGNLLLAMGHLDPESLIHGSHQGQRSRAATIGRTHDRN